MTSKMPEWIEVLADDPAAPDAENTGQLIIALRIAWKALSAYENDDIGTAKEALEKICALGGK